MTARVDLLEEQMRCMLEVRKIFQSMEQGLDGLRKGFEIFSRSVSSLKAEGAGVEQQTSLVEDRRVGENFIASASEQSKELEGGIDSSHNSSPHGQMEVIDQQTNQLDSQHEVNMDICDDFKTPEQQLCSEHVEVAAMPPSADIQKKTQLGKAGSGNGPYSDNSKSSNILSQVIWHPFDLSVRPVMPSKKNDTLLSQVFVIRHSTFIGNNLAGPGLLGSLTDVLRDKQDKVRRFSMAALRELLFYISTPNEQSRDNNTLKSPSKDNRSTSGWQIPSPVIALVSSILRKGENDTTQYYALRTIENVCSQDGDCVAWFVRKDVLFSPQSIQLVLEKLSFTDIASVVVKGIPCEQQIRLNLLNKAMVESPMFTNMGNLRIEYCNSCKDQCLAANGSKECLLVAIKGDPKGAYFWVNLANAYSVAGNYRSLGKYLEKAVKLEPSCMSTRYAIVVYRVKDAVKGQAFFDQLSCDGNERVSILKEGDSANLYRQQKHYESAKRMLAKVLAYNSLFNLTLRTRCYSWGEELIDPSVSYITGHVLSQQLAMQESLDRASPARSQQRVLTESVLC